MQTGPYSGHKTVVVVVGCCVTVPSVPCHCWLDIRANICIHILSYSWNDYSHFDE